MMLLDNDKLAALEEEFNEHTEGIELANYIWLMKSAINAPEKDLYELVNGLINLFQDIDINGDSHMEWKEFTQYIIDAVIGQQNTKFFDARLEKERDLDEIEILENAYSSKAKRYAISKQIDKTIHQNIIKKMIYEEDNDNLMFLEINNTKIKILNQSDHNNDEQFDSQNINSNQKNSYLQIINLPANDTNTKNFILDFAYSKTHNIIGAITSDRLNYFWDNNKNYKLVKQFKSDVLSTGIWWLQMHQYWVKAGADYNIRGYKWDNYSQELKLEFSFPAHTKQIMDIKEIKQPKLLASCSLDTKIRLYDLTEMKLLTEFKDTNSTRGIKGLQYSDEFGGNLLSFGFENYVNVWCPQISLTRSFIGKLEGHVNIIVGCKFVKDSPNVITIDDRTNIRVWDIRILQTVQVISSDIGTLIVNDIEIITKHDKFVLGGKRLQFYENQAVGKNMKAVQEEVHPLLIDFNTYFNQFLVLSKLDVRIYDALTGKLKKVMNFMHEDNVQAELTTFELGGRQRKIYVSDNSGLIKCYNIRDGEYIQTVNNPKELQKNDFESKAAHIQQKETNDINVMKYIHSDNLLVVGSSDGTIRIYDQSDQESNKSELLKVLSGGHKNQEVISLEVCKEMDIVMSGSVNGILSIWSIETGQYQFSYLAHLSDIVSIQLVRKYNLVLTASTDGSICLFQVKGKSRTYSLNFLLRFNNFCNDKSNNSQLVSITQMKIIQQNSSAIATKNLTQLSTIYTQSQLTNPITSTSTITQDQVQSIFTNNYTHSKNASCFDCISELIRQQNVQNKKDNKIINNNNNTNKDEQFLRNDLHYIFDMMNDQNEKSIETVKERVYMVIGDQKGHVSLLNLTEVIQFMKISGVSQIENNNQTAEHQLKRKEITNASKQIQQYINKDSKCNLELKSVQLSSTIILNRWQAHSQTITALNLVENPQSVITGSLDRQVKCWSISGQSYGGFHMTKLNLNQNKWKFPFDWVKIKLDQMDFVFETLKLFDNNNTIEKTQEEKDQIKFDYLVNKYFNGNYTLAKFNTQYQNILQASKNHPVSKQQQNWKTYDYQAITTAQKDFKHRKEIEKENEKFLKSTQKSLTNQENKQEKIQQLLKQDRCKKIFDKMQDLDVKYKLNFNQNQEYSEQNSLKFQQQQKQKKQGMNYKNIVQDSNNLNQSQHSNINSTNNFISNNAIDQSKKLNIMKKSQTSSQSQSLNYKIKDINQQQQQQQQQLESKLPTVQSQLIINKIKNNPNIQKNMFNIDEANEMGIKTVNSFKLQKQNKIMKKEKSLTSNAFFSHQKHAQFVNRLIKSIPTKIKVKLDPKFDDIKHKEDEGLRALQIATQSQKNFFISNSQNIKCDNNLVLQKQLQYYQNNLNKDITNNAAQITQKQLDKQKVKKKTDDQRDIVASNAFINNPSYNVHKILKTNDKIYVIKGLD